MSEYLAQTKKPSISVFSNTSIAKTFLRTYKQQCSCSKILV